MDDRIDAFLTHAQSERSLSPHTVSAYRNDLRQFAEFLRAEGERAGGGGIALASVDRERLGGFFLYLRERGYSPATIARKVAALKSFFHYLRRAGQIAVDPTEGIGSPEVKKALPQPISADDVQVLLEHAQSRDTPEGLRASAMLRLLYATGMRVTELVTLDLADVDVHKGTVRVAGRGSRGRVLPLDPATLAALSEYLERARPFLARGAPTQTALVLNHRGQRLTRQGFWLIMKGLVRDSGLKLSVTPHTLRHSFATHQIGEGRALEELRQLLGHASISTTQVYTQLAGREYPVAPPPAGG
jgi:integrase/recombinase XerD